MTRTPVTADKKFDRFARAGATMLEARGWVVVMAGPYRVVSRDMKPKFRYTLELDFVGRRPRK